MSAMGRRRTKDLDLPPRMRRRRFKSGVRYYYDHGYINGRRVWEALSNNFAEAKQKWAKIESEGPGPPSGTFAALAEHYLEHGTGPVPWRKKPLSERGIADAREHVRNLREVFGDIPANQITDEDVSRYLSMRSAPIRANREIATMSSIYKHGQRTQQVSGNPTLRVPRNAEQGRDHCPTDAEFEGVWKLAPPVIQVGMDFAYLTGMRLGDMLRLPIPRDPEGIFYREGKTGQKHIVEWDDALRDVVRRAMDLRKVTGMTLFANRRGQPYTVNGWESMWQRTLRKATKEGVERFRWHDIRAKAATDANQAGQDSRSLLGHKSEQQHLAYLRSKAPLRAKPVTKGGN